MPAGQSPKRVYKKTQLLREELLDAAEALFAERGFEKTSIRDITNHLGVRLAAVNYHFDSKYNLLVGSYSPAGWPSQRSSSEADGRGGAQSQ